MTTNLKKEGIAQGRPGQKSATTSSFALNTANVDGIKESVATAVTEQVYDTSAELDGADMASGEAYLDGTEARNVTVTLSTSVGSYSGGTFITVEGKHPSYTDSLGNPIKQTELLEIPDDDGNVTLTSAKCFKAGAGAELIITIPAQQDTDGAIEIGTGVAKSVEPPARWLYVNATGTLFVRLTDDADEKISKFVVDTVGSKPISCEALHAGTDVTDLVAVID